MLQLQHRQLLQNPRLPRLLLAFARVMRVEKLETWVEAWEIVVGRRRGRRRALQRGFRSASGSDT
jgi:hypothetical protein